MKAILASSRITHSLGTYLVVRQVKKRLFIAVPEAPIRGVYPTPRLIKFMGDFIEETFSPAIQIKALEPIRSLLDYGNN